MKLLHAQNRPAAPLGARNGRVRIDPQATGLPGRRRRIGRRVAILLILVVAATGTSGAYAFASSGTPTQPTTISGGITPDGTTSWSRDFYDDFTGHSLSATWGKYGYGKQGQAIGHGGMGVYDPNDVWISNGNMLLSTKYENGAWTGPGVSSGHGFAAVQGKWEVRAKFPVHAQGIGYAMLLYPTDGTWPPEVDIAEGRVDGPRMEANFHYGTYQNQLRMHVAHDFGGMHNWHTYGVIITKTTITYTLDGRVWASFNSSSVPTKPLWIGFQASAHSCPSQYECVAGNVPNADTPAVSTISIAWVAHYQAA